MELIYLWVEDYKNIKKQCFNFSPRFTCKYDEDTKVQAVMEKYLEESDFHWRGLGDIPKSGMSLHAEYDGYNAQKKYDAILPKTPIDDHKLCICGDILKGKASQPECSIFGTACKPTTPIGSCMVSSEGACAAYYKYGNLIS